MSNGSDVKLIAKETKARRNKVHNHRSTAGKFAHDLTVGFSFGNHLS